MSLLASGPATTATTVASSATSVAAPTATTVATKAAATVSAKTATTVASTTATTVVTTAKSVSAGSLMFQMLIGLGVVLAIIWFASRILRGRVARPGIKKAPLAVVGRQPLGKGVQIAIVKAGAELYLLGVTAHQVTRLGRIRPEELDMAVVPSAASGSPDDLPPAVSAAPGSPLPVPFRLQSTIRSLQNRTLRKN